MQNAEHADAVACELSPSDLVERLAEWRELTAQAHTRTAGPGWMRSTYPRSALETIRALVAAEAACCPFLSFDVVETSNAVELELRFPPEAGPMLAAAMSGVSASEA